VWASELVKDDDYWKLVMQVATASTLKRILRTTQIMGRSESDTLHASQILYPCMQVADIFFLKADVCQLGMDQRKVNVLARELAEKLGRKKPIIVSHHMLMGLAEPPKTDDAVERANAMKMSKSRPDTAIFVTDTTEDIKRKLTKAYCPAKQAAENPVLEYCKYLLFELNRELVVERPEKFGGTVSFANYEELERAFVAGELHPMDLKAMVAKYLDAALQPIRDHFAKDARARKLQEQVASFVVTR
ncbi:tyrosine--tRNA ligase, partial [Candidatus Woesearchaeota archaeon]